MVSPSPSKALVDTKTKPKPGPGSMPGSCRRREAGGQDEKSDGSVAWCSPIRGFH
jgi:hypothetical protein